MRFSRGALFHLLKNRVYLGEILHKGAAYPNAHPAIVAPKVFEAVQVTLADKAGAGRMRRTGGGKVALTGLIFDAQGRPMSPAFSYGRSKRCYRYYVSAPLQKGGAIADDDTLRRVPGQIVDDLVLDAVSRLARRIVTAVELRHVLRGLEIHLDHVRLSLVRQVLSGRICDPRLDLAMLEQRLSPGEEARVHPADDALVHVTLPVRVKVRGGRSWMATPDGRVTGLKGHLDLVLVGGLVRAQAAIAEAGVRPDGKPASRKTKAPASAYQRSLAGLAFLAPDIQAAIVAGRQPAGLKLEHLLRMQTPLAWADQRALFGF